MGLSITRVVALTPNPIADAHMHLWDPRTHYYPWLCDAQPIAFRYGDYRALRRPYLPADYRADAAGWPVERAVYIEAEWDPRDPGGEMDFIARLRDEFATPTVAVAQAWLDAEDCAAVLEAHARRSFVRGVRHKPKAGQMDDARWRSGYARLAPLGLHFELQASWRQLGEAARLAGDFPGTTIVLNHAGLPLPGEIPGWRAAMAALGRFPNVSVKISGLGSLDRPARRATILGLIDTFGTQRAMFASNYPVDSLRMSFDEIFGEFQQATHALSEAERRRLFHDNAVRTYRME
jgi:predicted TIM-barrel fold metal-dependent hydrolase